jgi:hypothetical protein
MKKLVIGLVLAALLTLVLAGGALAASSPQAIYDDYAAHGTLTGHYTIPELQAYLNDATVRAEGNPRTVAELDVLANQLIAQSRSSFPFTGAELGLLLLGGVLLVGSGLLLRRRAR